MVVDDAEALLSKNLENARTNLGHISYDLDYLRDQMTITEVMRNEHCFESAFFFHG